MINVPPRGIGQKSVETLKEKKWDLQLIDEKTLLPFSTWVKKNSELSTLELMEEVLEKTKYIEWLNDGSEENNQRIENIYELKSVASQFVNLEEFLENVALIESSDKPRADDYNAVTLMTVHASKGLEFPVIFVVGMEEGLFPHSQSLGEVEELEEERRLCYVAITRAMEKVYLTYAYSRLYFGDIQSNLPSRFLEEIPKKLITKMGFSEKKYRQEKPPLHLDEYMDDLDYDRKNFSWD